MKLLLSILASSLMVASVVSVAAYPHNAMDAHEASNDNKDNTKWCSIVWHGCIQMTIAAPTTYGVLHCLKVTCALHARLPCLQQRPASHIEVPTVCVMVMERQHHSLLVKSASSRR